VINKLDKISKGIWQQIMSHACGTK